jgi:hypothetical protein
MIYLVAYRLTPDRDYTALLNTLKNAPTISWWHYIDNLWLIKTDESAHQLQNRMDPYLNIGVDSVLITEVNLHNYRAWLPQDAHDWIKNNR